MIKCQHLHLQSKQRSGMPFSPASPWHKLHFQLLQVFLEQPHAHLKQPNEVEFWAIYLVHVQLALYSKTNQLIKNFQLLQQYEERFFSLNQGTLLPCPFPFLKTQLLRQYHLIESSRTRPRSPLKPLVWSSMWGQSCIFKVFLHISSRCLSTTSNLSLFDSEKQSWELP